MWLTIEKKFISLFGGIGGFDLPLIKKGWECVGYYEIDKYCVQTYNKNFKTNYNPTDITKVRADDIADHTLLCAGFPCQSFSIAGKRRGFQDTRGTLFFEIARILKAKKPDYFILENVKGLLNHDKGQTFKVILQTMDELGYEYQWMVLNSKFFGVPQNRERVFIIGNLRGQSKPEILPFGESNGVYNEKEYERSAKAMTSTMFKGIGNDGTTLIDERDRELTRIYGINGNAPTLKGKTGGWQEPKILAQPLKFLGRNQKNLQGEYSFTIDSVNTGGVAILDLYNKKEHSDRSPALTEPHHNTLRVREGMKIRKLTPIECERLQGFSDNFTQGVSDTQRYKQLGNAVTTKVVEAIANKLHNNIFNLDGGWYGHT